MTLQNMRCLMHKQTVRRNCLLRLVRAGPVQSDVRVECIFKILQANCEYCGITYPVQSTLNVSGPMPVAGAAFSPIETDLRMDAIHKSAGEIRVVVIRS